MLSELKEKLWQLFGLALGSMASWPSVLRLFDVIPDFTAEVRLGSAAGFIFGSFLYFTNAIPWLASKLKSNWQRFTYVLIATLWLYLNWKLPQIYGNAIDAPNITPERIKVAKLAIWGVAVLWAMPLSYVGALLGDRISAALREKS